MNADKTKFFPRENWTECYRTGVEMNRLLPKHATLSEVGRAISVTKQNAYTETVVALGKLVLVI